MNGSETAAIQFDFFIAHAGGDKKTAERLYEVLKPHAKVFLANRDVAGGASWAHRIDQAQKRSACTLAIISKHTEQATYLEDEIRLAIDEWRRTKGAHAVIPLYVHGIPSHQGDMPYGLRTFQGRSLKTADFDETIAQLLSRTTAELPLALPRPSRFTKGRIGLVAAAVALMLSGVAIAATRSHNSSLVATRVDAGRITATTAAIRPGPSTSSIVSSLSPSGSTTTSAVPNTSSTSQVDTTKPSVLSNEVTNSNGNGANTNRSGTAATQPSVSKSPAGTPTAEDASVTTAGDPAAPASIDPTTVVAATPATTTAAATVSTTSATTATPVATTTPAATTPPASGSGLTTANFEATICYKIDIYFTQTTTEPGGYLVETTVFNNTGYPVTIPSVDRLFFGSQTAKNYASNPTSSAIAWGSGFELPYGQTFTRTIHLATLPAVDAETFLENVRSPAAPTASCRLYQTNTVSPVPRPT
jgi:hypothetical protein